MPHFHTVYVPQSLFIISHGPSVRNLEHVESMEMTGRLLELVYDSSVSWALVQAALEVISSVISTASPKVGVPTYPLFSTFSHLTCIIRSRV